MELWRDNRLFNKESMDWLRGPLPVTALRELINAYVPKFQNRQFASRRHGRSIWSIAALSDTTVVWCEEGGRLSGWFIPTDKHWIIGQLLDSHTKCLVGVSRTQFVVLTPRSTLQEWDVSLGRHRFVEEVDGSPQMLALLSNGELAISDCDGSIGVWNRRDCTYRNIVPSPNTWWGYWRSFVWKPPISHRDYWTCLESLPDCRLAAGSSHGVVCIFDGDSGACLQTLHRTGSQVQSQVLLSQVQSQVEGISFMSWRVTTDSLLISTMWGVVEWDLSRIKTARKGHGHFVSLEDGSVVLFDLSFNVKRNFADLGHCRFVVVLDGLVAVE